MSIMNVNAENYQTYTQAGKPVPVKFPAPRCVRRRLPPGGRKAT